MKIELAYGRNNLIVDLPPHIDIIKPIFAPGLLDEETAIQEALHNPVNSPSLSEILSGCKTVAIAHTDITRATPNDRLLPPLLKVLEQAGIAKENITLFNGLGTHRKQTPEELEQMLGEQITNHYACVQHDCFDESNLEIVGKSKTGAPIKINKQFLQADLKILTGFIEPHIFAGFSGGPKAILPSLAGFDTIFENHSFQMVADPNATWGKLDGNPIQQSILDTALIIPNTFLLNVLLNDKKQITHVFAGDMLAAHRKGCELAKQQSMVPVQNAYDLVITTNSGYPLDQNLYQSIKGMSAAVQIVKPGGAIIIAAACEDGLPDHGLYGQMLRESRSVEEILEKIKQPGFKKIDQWQIQLQALVLQKAEVHIYSDGLSEAQIRDAFFVPCDDIQASAARLTNDFASDKNVCVMPDGPLTIPYIQ